MGNLLKEGLKALCGTNHWSYAVLWMFAPQNPKFLVWEECYYTQVPDLELCFLERKMMVENHVNVVGQGLVGEVAVTGNHMWILYENYSTEAYPPEILKDISQQFSAGIQTVAVIPILSQGVIQLGSCLSIPEDVSFVSDSMLFVSQLGCVPNSLRRTNLVVKELSQGRGEPSYPVLDTPHELSMMSAGSFSASDRLCALPGRHVDLGIAEPREFYFSSASKLYDGSCRSSSGNTNPVLDTDSLSDGCQVISGSVVGSDCLINGIDTSNTSKMVSCFSDFMNNIEHNDVCARPQSEVDSFNILGTDFGTNFFRNHYSPTPRSLDCGVSSSGTGNLLDAAASNVYPSIDQVLDDSVSCLTTNNSTSYQFELSNHVEDEVQDIPEYLQNSGAYSPKSYANNSQAKQGHKMKCGNTVFARHCRKRQRMNKVNHHKRQKPGKILRPKPKDRQMLQDRLKELRELVPNGAKCSIDALLERTAKHMLFLQGVEKHPDKLSHIPDLKNVCEDGCLPVKEGFEGGATWAYEVGAKSMLCPIIVKDLNKPRQMLVEVLCDERASFFEVADVLKGLGLIILKGETETWINSILARFTIKVHRHITRMEIFLSLVRMWEKSSNGHSS